MLLADLTLFSGLSEPRHKLVSPMAHSCIANKQPKAITLSFLQLGSAKLARLLMSLCEERQFASRVGAARCIRRLINSWRRRCKLLRSGLLEAFPI